MAKAELGEENLEALERGLSNLRRHLRNIREVWGLRPVVALNRFTSDTDAEIELVRRAAAETGAKVALCEVWAKGGEGGRELAKLVMEEASHADPAAFTFTYPDDMPLADKIRAVATRIYGAKDVSFTPAAMKTPQAAHRRGLRTGMPVCIAKTQYSFSDDPKKLGAPEGFTLTIRSVRVSAGAGFVVALSGDIMTMPGLPKVPAAVKIDVTDDGKIIGAVLIKAG